MAWIQFPAFVEVFQFFIVFFVKDIKPCSQCTYPCFLLVIFSYGIYYGIPILPFRNIGFFYGALTMNVYAFFTSYPHLALFVFIESMYNQIVCSQIKMFERVGSGIITYHTFVIYSQPNITFAIFFYDIDNWVSAWHILGYIPILYYFMVFVQRQPVLSSQP